MFGWKQKVDSRLERLEKQVAGCRIVACAVCGRRDLARLMEAVSYPPHPELGQWTEDAEAHPACIAGSKYDRREAPREDKAEAEG